MRPVRPWQVLVALLAVVAAAQLLSRWLASRAPLPPPTLFADAAILADARAPALGRADAAVTIYLFSDYRCASCRAMHAPLRRLAAADPGVRVVYRDWPILGPRSTRAAGLALASVAQGRHAAFDDALMRRGGSLGEPELRAAAAAAGVDWHRLEADLATHRADIDALLADSDRHARALGFGGTPTLVIGPFLIVGGIGEDRLRDLVEAARAS